MNAPRKRTLGGAVAVVAVAVALFVPSGFAKGPAPKISSFSVSSSCLFTGTVSWKNLTVTEIILTLNKNGVGDGQDFIQSLGTLSSPQTGAVQGTASGTSSSFTLTAQLMDGSTQVGTATTNKAITANC